MNEASLVGYFLVFLAAIILAARWIYLNHPALRDINRTPRERTQKRADPPDNPPPRG